MATFTNVINESVLLDALSKSEVEQLSIQMTAENKYYLVAKLAWTNTACAITTTRGDVREWAVLDRLIKHMQSYPKLGDGVMIYFNKRKGNNNETSNNSS